MRAWMSMAVLFLLVPLSGCSSTQNLSISGLFNIPATSRGDPAPIAMEDCAQLHDFLNERALTEARLMLDRDVARYMDPDRDGGIAIDLMGDDVRLTASSAPMEDSTAAGSASSHTHSLASGPAPVTGTNNQEAGADEGDLVKTDGTWTYVYSRGVLHILNSKRLGDLSETSRLAIGQSWGGGELLLVPRGPGEADDRLVLVLPDQPERDTWVERDPASGAPLPHYGPMTHVVVVSLADRAKPKVDSETWVEGTSSGSRLIDGTAYIVVSSGEPNLGLRMYASPTGEDLAEIGLDWRSYAELPERSRISIIKDVALRADTQNREILDGLELPDHIPIVAEGGVASAVPVTPSDALCKNVLATPGTTGRGFTTILSLAVSEQEVRSATKEIVGTTAVFYASDKAIVLAAPSQDLWFLDAQADLQAATDVHWFDLDGLDVLHRASGRVPGLVEDSFAIDVRGDELRVASTLGAVAELRARSMSASASLVSQVTVFQAALGELLPKGFVTGIAPGERIWSARFTDDRAYLVTFPDPLQIIAIDPLWVVDLGGPIPTVLGELEVPGVSTYIHPVSDRLLLSIGYGPGPNDQGLDRSKLQISLFDISDLSEPKRADVLDLGPGDGRTFSTAAAEHKAFTYWSAAGLLAVPVSSSQEVPNPDGGSEFVMHVGLQLITVDAGRMELVTKGTLEQDALVDEDASWGLQVERSYFQGFPEIGVATVFLVSEMGVTAHDLSTMRTQDSVSFA